MAEGEFACLIGPNGAGKSTLFEVLSGFVRPDSGSVHYRDTPLEHLPPHVRTRLGIGRTFQTLRPFLGMLTVENVMVPLVAAGVPMAPARAEALRYLEFVGLGHKRNWPADTLSTGQRKRLELARAMATRPRLLLLDEICAGVDHRTLPDLVALLQRLPEAGYTVVMIEHNMRVVSRVCQRVMMLHLGQLIRDGTPDEVLSDPHVVQIYSGEYHA